MSAIMNEAEPTATAKPASAGAWLKQARLSKGLHIAALAVQLKVPQAKLEALEADRYQDLPDATFARALAKAMCRVLKVDAAPVLALLPASNGAGLERVSLGLNQPFRERPTQDEGMSLDWLKRPVVWGPALLLLAALLVYLVPERWTQLASTPSTATESPLLVPAAEPPASQAQAAPVEPAASLPSAVPAVTPAETIGTAVPLAAAQHGQSLLGLRASAETWIEVTDSRGQVLFSKLMRAGEQAELNVLTPVQLRVGNVAGAEVVLRGTHIDLQAVAKDNVARLELN